MPKEFKLSDIVCWFWSSCGKDSEDKKFCESRLLEKDASGRGTYSRVGQNNCHLNISKLYGILLQRNTFRGTEDCRRNALEAGTVNDIEMFHIPLHSNEGKHFYQH